MRAKQESRHGEGEPSFFLHSVLWYGDCDVRLSRRNFVVRAVVWEARTGSVRSMAYGGFGMMKFCECEPTCRHAFISRVGTII